MKILAKYFGLAVGP